VIYVLPNIPCFTFPIKNCPKEGILYINKEIDNVSPNNKEMSESLPRKIQFLYFKFLNLCSML